MGTHKPTLHADSRDAIAPRSPSFKRYKNKCNARKNKNKTQERIRKVDVKGRKFRKIGPLSECNCMNWVLETRFHRLPAPGDNDWTTVNIGAAIIELAFKHRPTTGSRSRVPGHAVLVRVYKPRQLQYLKTKCWHLCTTNSSLEWPAGTCTKFWYQL